MRSFLRIAMQRSFLKKLIAISLLLLLAIPYMSFSSSAIEDPILSSVLQKMQVTAADASASSFLSNAKRGGEEAAKIADGVYKLKSMQDGKYCESFDYSFDSQGRLHVDLNRSALAQQFVFVLREDGTYSICPKNEDGVYMLCWSENISANIYINKTTEDGENTRFYITENKDGSFYISPASEKLSSYVLGESSHTHRWNYNLVTLQKKDGSASQKWQFDRVGDVGNISLSLNKSEVVVKLYTVNDLFAVTTPSIYKEKVRFYSSNPEVALVDEKTGSFCALSVGNATIVAKMGNTSVSCKVRVSDKDAFTWYSQASATNGGWNGYALKNVYFSAYGIVKPFIIDGFNYRTDWMDEGCALTSYAMVLNNLGAKLTSGYDFRSGQSKNLDADPYTCALANSYNTGIKSSTGTMSYDPILVYGSLIASRFNVGGKAVTVENHYWFTKKDIKEALDKHPEGVVVGFENYYSGTHYIVFTECVNPDEPNPNNYQFLVCDPAALDAEHGDNVLFENSPAYRNMYYNFYHTTTMTTFNVAD